MVDLSLAHQAGSVGLPLSMGERAGVRGFGSLDHPALPTLSPAGRGSPPPACLGARLRLAIASILFLASSPPSARADTISDFYKAKPVTLIVSSSAGGGYDTLARTVARFLGRHLPGNPSVVVRNMAGAGGIAAANFLYNAADKDGSQIGLLQNNTPFAPIFNTKDV